MTIKQKAVINEEIVVETEGENVVIYNMEYDDPDKVYIPKSDIEEFVDYLKTLK